MIDFLAEVADVVLDIILTRRLSSVPEVRADGI